MIFIDWQHTPLVNFDTLHASKKPHYCLVSPNCQGERCIHSTHYTIPVAELKNRWQAMLKQQPRVKLVRSDNKANQYQYVQRSLILRFPDLIDVKFVDLGNNQSTLYAYSRSIYGYSDLGVNCKRMRHWLEGIK